MTGRTDPCAQPCPSWPLRAALLALLALAACTSAGPGSDKRNPPAGATPAEYGFQYAQMIARNGNCDQALPVFICLGGQGRGWELALHSGGVCAIEAARHWSGPITRRGGFYGKNSKISFDAPYYRSQGALRAKGLALLRQAAAAGWPDSQAFLVQELSRPGAPQADLQEARLWLHQYDLSPRRKIYGSNAIDPAVRQRLSGITLPAGDAGKILHQDLQSRPAHDPFCRQLLSHRSRARPAPSADDGLDKLPGQPATPGESPLPDHDGDRD